LLRDIAKDEVISFGDVKLPATRLSDELWQEQRKRWPTAARSGTADAKREPLIATIS
jgi:hypothetical protein